MRQPIRPNTVSLTGITTQETKGKRYVYYRHRGKRIPLPDLPFDHPDFLKAYSEAKAKLGQRPTEYAAGTIYHLSRACLTTTRFKAAGDAYKAMLRRHLDQIAQTYGAGTLSTLKAKHIRADMETCTAQAHRLKAWRFLCDEAVHRDLMDFNVAKLVKGPTQEGPGHLPWEPHEIDAFRQRYQIGTTIRACFELLHWSGARISDVVKFSRGMVDADGVLTFSQKKTDNPAHIPWTCPVPHYADPADRDMMFAALECLKGHMTFLATVKGGQRSSKSMGGTISKAAKDIGITDKTAHGLRKTRLITLAENRASALEIQAWGGHVTLEEVQHYIQAAERRRAVIGTEQIRNTVKPAVKL